MREFLKILTGAIASLSLTYSVFNFVAVSHVPDRHAHHEHASYAEQARKALLNHVTIVSQGAQGSGTLFVRDGKVFVWTAAHVVEDSRVIEYTKDPVTGEQRVNRIRFKPVKIVQHIRNKDTDDIVEVKYKALVVRYSNAWTREDLALLYVPGVLQPKHGPEVEFHKGAPNPGDPIYHTGSFWGLDLADSSSYGHISQLNRVYEGITYDQVDLTIVPGSSGGAVYLSETNKYVGMLVRGNRAGTVGLIVPVRRIWKWAKEQDLLWALDRSVKLPDLSKLFEKSIQPLDDYFSEQNYQGIRYSLPDEPEHGHLKPIPFQFMIWPRKK